MTAAEDPFIQENYLSSAQKREMLRRMLRIRLFDGTASHIQSNLIPGMLHNSTGQEGAIVGACMALRDDDYMTGSHRSHGHPIAKGAPLAPLLAELLGKSGGVCGGKGGSMHLAAFSVGSLGESGIVGASMPAAVGAALSATLRNTDQVCLSFFGDGAANCGPFHESLNLAATWKLPVVFFCENNGYAVCTEQTTTTSVEDIALRAKAYGMPGVVVDGQDVLAVHRVVCDAVSQARKANGPTLVEAKTYRYCNHVEGVSFPPYRSDEEVTVWKARDPIELFSRWLLGNQVCTADELSTLRAEVAAEVAAALEFAQGSADPDPESLFADVYL